MIPPDMYIKFLKSLGLFPIDKWNQFEAEHQIEMKPKVRNNHTVKLRNQGKATSGVYVYFDCEICLYVGESSNLGDRFKDHYNESWKENPKGRNYKQFSFFKQYQKPLIVKWIEIEDSFDRKIVEAMLTKILKPLYEEYKKTI
ncbi:GIY-YIG nuclease family protein [Priestia flexa]|uniref:GIY-YIG nuclease family protein n=1 Tax=Priestia flexa TaxID=86664 RepID=UPI003D2A569C